MKKTLTLLILGLLLSTQAFSFFGFGKKKDDNSKKTVTIWAWDKNFNVSIMEKAKKIYEANHPNIDIQVVDYAKADIETKLHTGLTSGARKGLPDITLIEDYNIQKFLTSYPGYFANLKDNIDYSKFAQYKVKAMTVDNGIYGVPFDSGVTGMFYRKDLLKKSGFTEKDLTNITWDRFIEIGKVVKQKTGVALLCGDMFGDGGLIRIMMQSAGSWYFDKNGNVTLADNKALKEAIKVLKQVNDNGLMRPTKGWGEWVGAMNKGETATVVSGIWVMPSIKAATDQSGKWGITTIPRLNIASSINASNLGGSSWFVLEKSKVKNEAIDFLKTLYAGNNDFYQQILTENGAVGTYLPSQSGSAYNKADEFFGGQVVYKDFSKWLKEIPGVNYGSFVSEADVAVLNALSSVLNNNVSIDKALENAQTQLEAQIR